VLVMLVAQDLYFFIGRKDINMKYAWIEDNKVRDICQGGNPSEHYHPDIAAYYTTEVADDVVNGAVLDGSTWVNPSPSAPHEISIVETILNVAEFKARFTSAERIALKTAKATDAVIDDFFDIIDDQRLTTVDLRSDLIVDAVKYMVSKDFLTQARANVIASIPENILPITRI